MASWYCCAVSAIASSIARLSAAEGQTALVLMTTGSAVAGASSAWSSVRSPTASNSGELAVASVRTHRKELQMRRVTICGADVFADRFGEIAQVSVAVKGVAADLDIELPPVLRHFSHRGAEIRSAVGEVRVQEPARVRENIVRKFRDAPRRSWR